MTFDPDDPRLTAFALGELDDLDRLAVEAMLANSPEARRFVAEVRETAAILTETLRGEPSPGLSIVQRIDLDAYPNVKRWYLAIAGRPAVQRGYHVPARVNDIPLPAQ